jgi:AraC family transcriptional regulator of adaptative response/methylated-DNA-[protein]-cysteine methyltransferase
MSQELVDYNNIEKAIEFIHQHYNEQPELDRIAEVVGLNPFHFQRLFIRWAGVSPKKFLQYITLEESKLRLDNGINLSEVAYDVSLSGPSRLYDLYCTFEGMTLQQYKNGGQGITIYYATYLSPFGRYLLAVTQNKRICNLSFTENEKKSIEEIQNCWFNSELIHSEEKTADIAKNIFDFSSIRNLNFFVKGTSFQLKVWDALLRIPFGHIVSYQTVSDYLGKPGALQAVGSAIARNPVAFLIPCHRVIRKTGIINEYRWGTTRKTAMIGWEASKVL